MAQMSRRVLFTSGTMGAVAALGLSKYVGAAEHDSVLDHAGKEFVRLHTHNLGKASTLALAASNLRLLATHPQARSPLTSGVPDMGRVHREMKHRHGYVGTVEDLQKLTLGAPPAIEHYVAQKVQSGRMPDVLLWSAHWLDHVAARLDKSTLNTKWFIEDFKPRLVQYDLTGDSGPDMQHYQPCDVLFAISVGLGGATIIASMMAAGPIIAGLLGTVALAITIIRYGGC